MPNPKEVTLDLDIPPEFASACKALDILPQQVLQQFIDQLSVYDYLLSPTNKQKAIGIFKAYLDQRGFIPPPDAARKLHTRCMRQLVGLIRSKSSPEKKEPAYRQLIEEWSNSLMITQ